jgi:hypothetical protein
MRSRQRRFPSLARRAALPAKAKDVRWANMRFGRGFVEWPSFSLKPLPPFVEHATSPVVSDVLLRRKPHEEKPL